MNITWKIVSLLFFLTLGSSAFAARPLSVDDAATVDRGSWEIEEGYELDQPRNGGDSSGNFGTSVKYGLLNNLDVGIEFPYSASDPSGVGDAVVKGKLALTDKLALGINVKLTNADADSGLGSGYADYGLNGIFTTQLGAAETSLNVGYTVVGQDGGASPDTNELSYGAAVVYPLSEKANFMGEICGSSVPSQAPDPLDALLGINFGFNDLFTIDGGISLGLTDASSKYRATVGSTLIL